MARRTAETPDGRTVTVPAVHLNGTSGDELADQLRTAWAAVDAAINALTKAAPSMRDYYPQGPDAWPAADTEHCERLRRLYDTRSELCSVWEAVSDQIDERNRMRGGGR